MAAEWIKMRIDLQSHPKVVRILSATGADKFRVIGGLHAVWGVFDLHSEDGRLCGYTPDLMDHIIGWSGFSQAMIAVGWMRFDGAETLDMPEFSEHNGQSAKRRAEDQKRKRNGRKTVRIPSGDDADKLRTESGLEIEKKEKEKKDQEQEATPLCAGAPPFGVHQPIVDAYHELLPNCQSIATPTPKRIKRLANAVKLAKRVCASNGWTYEPETFWRGYFAVCANDPWMRGDVANPNNPRWKQNLDVLLADERLAQVIDQAIHSMREAA